MVWLVTCFVRGGKIVRFGMGGDEEHAAFFFFLVPALVFGGLQAFFNWETEVASPFACAVLCIFTRDVLMGGKTVREGGICYR